MRLPVFLILLAIPAAASAQQQDNSAKRILTQPVRDVGAEKTKIPPVLIAAGEAPYSLSGARTCGAIKQAIVALDRELGPDYGAPAVAEGNDAERIAAAGGSAVVNSLIPFRGLVREISGAGPAERRLQAAVDAGIARRGFLRGLQSARGCRR